VFIDYFSITSPWMTAIGKQNITSAYHFINLSGYSSYNWVVKTMGSTMGGCCILRTCIGIFFNCLVAWPYFEIESACMHVLSWKRCSKFMWHTRWTMIRWNMVWKGFCYMNYERSLIICFVDFESFLIGAVTYTKMNKK